MHLFNRLFARGTVRFAARARGFTLIELLIVIVIIGILAVGFAPTVLNAPKKARDAVRKGNIAAVKQAVEAYAVDKNSVYPVAAALTCAEDLNTANSSFNDYFQGKVLPVDSSPQLKVGAKNCTSGIAYQADGSTCYLLVTQLEAGNGNYDAAPSDCKTNAVKPVVSTNAYQLTVVKYN